MATKKTEVAPEATPEIVYPTITMPYVTDGVVAEVEGFPIGTKDACPLRAPARA